VNATRTHLQVATLPIGASSKSLEGATMPKGQKYEDWLKSREEDGEG
jgi:hypothetical protein